MKDPNEKIETPIQPEPGTWADIARFMAEEFPDEDWDAWKDEMKEGDL